MISVSPSNLKYEVFEHNADAQYKTIASWTSKLVHDNLSQILILKNQLNICKGRWASDTEYFKVLGSGPHKKGIRECEVVSFGRFGKLRLQKKTMHRSWIFFSKQWVLGICKPVDVRELHFNKFTMWIW